MGRSDTVRMGFTGTQLGMTRAQKSEVARVLVNAKATEVHHGDCIGADAEFHDIVRMVDPKIKIHVHPPAEDKKRAFKRGDVLYPAKPYLERNHDIVDACEILIATPAQKNEVLRSGTWATIRYARKIKRSTIIITPNGNSELK